MNSCKGSRLKIDFLWRRRREALREESRGCFSWWNGSRYRNRRGIRSEGSRVLQHWVIISMAGSPLGVTPHSPVCATNGSSVPSPAAALAPVPLRDLCATACGVPRNGEHSAFLACLSDVVLPCPTFKVAPETARGAEMDVGIMSHMVVIWVALVEVGSIWVDGFDCNQGCLLRDCVEMVVARNHGLADGGRAGHFWWQEERYDSCHCCFCVDDCSHCALRSCTAVHGDLRSCMQKNMNAMQ